VLVRCLEVAPGVQSVLDAQFEAGSRIIAVATRDVGDASRLTPATSTTSRCRLPDLRRSAEARRRQFYGTSGEAGRHRQDRHWRQRRVATKLCADLGISVAGTLTGAAVETMSDDELAAALPSTSIFARVTPEQKSRIVEHSRSSAPMSGFWGTASMTQWRCTTPTWGSQWIPAATWPRTLPTSCCSTRTWASLPTASSRAGAFSPIQ